MYSKHLFIYAINLCSKRISMNYIEQCLSIYILATFTTGCVYCFIKYFILTKATNQLQWPHRDSIGDWNMSNNFCPHCGTPTIPGATFCASCGNKLPNAVPTANPQPAGTKDGTKVKTGTKGLIKGILLALIAPIITWIIAIIMHKNYRKSGNLSDAKGLKVGFLTTLFLEILIVVLFGSN